MAHKMGIIGYGGMAGWHHENSKRIKDFKVVAAHDIDAGRLAAAKERGLKPYETLKDFLLDDSFDLVLVATPNNFHKPMVIAALQAGKNVICEKPATLSSADFQDMIACADKNKKLLVVHQNRRWDEDFLMIKKLYDEGTIGPFFNVESRVMGSRGIPGDWRKIKAQGGGMMLDWGVHLIDQILFMTKSPIVNVYCEYSFIFGEECEDGFKLLLTFEDGMRAHIEVDTNHFEVLPRWMAFGMTGSATVKDWSCEGTSTVPIVDEGDAAPIKAGSGVTKTMAPRSFASLDIQTLAHIHTDVTDYYRNVMAVLDGKAEIIVKNAEVMRVLRVMEAAYQSAMEGVAVKTRL